MSKMKTNLLVAAIACLGMSGCSQPDSSAEVDVDTGETVVMDALPPMLEEDIDVHAHPEHGPHGGDLVELGKEAFHAELTHGEEGVSMYVLDGAATKQVAIESEKLTVSLKHDDSVKSFDLAANPDATDPSGKSSRFTSSDETLDQWLDAGAEGAVVIEIEGKSYTGKVAHDHDHAGHDH